jgi:hypothetical protein
MFCYKCGERLWDGRISCQKCGVDVPRAVLDAENPSARKWPVAMTALGLVAALAAGFALGRAAFRPFHASPRPAAPDEQELITPLNVRDPSALIMYLGDDRYCACPSKKAQ